MSNTFKTNNARAAHKKLDTVLNDRYDEGDKRSVIFREVEQAGERHGNNRLYYAQKKVLERRAERKSNNRFSLS